MIKSASDVRKPYSGPTRSLVIALDIGTTFSGVSYAILEPGEIPKIYGVTRFPGQEHVAGNSKIPSILYYDRDGTVIAAGAEADNASISSQAEDDGWIKAELFKLRLRPKSMKLNMNGMRLSSLPRHKPPVDVFGDFLHYLFRCTRSFIIDTHANGKVLWQAVEDTIEFVLSHPNGWEGAQQTRMRRAAVHGGLIPDTDEGRARIRFVTEGEASLHACVQSGLAADILSNPSRHGFLVCDAGGGTLDISSYAVRSTNPLVIEEIAPPDCIFAGSVFVSRRAREFLAEKLKNSKYGSPDSIDHITKRFDETTKRLFRDKNGIQWIPFGSPLDKDPAVGIRGGSLKLTGAEVAELFEPSIQAAITSIKSQVMASQGMIKSVWLVGGFAASPWLFAQLQEYLTPMKITVSRPDNQTSKAVADGALGFYCDHHVSARVSKFMYGVEYLREFDPNDPEHVARKERLCELPSGPQLLPDAFDCILARSVKVKESTVFTRKYCTELTSLSTLSVFEVEIWCYRGGDNVPPWILRQHEEYSTLCVVRADLSPLSGSAEPKSGRGGKTYWTIVFSVEIHFGLTEFRARIKWNDNGRTKYGPASIVYSESGHRADEDETESSYSEDDLGPSRSASRGPSRAASVAPSRTHSQDSVGSGAKTPQGGSARLDATYMDAVSRSRSVSSSQQSAHSRSQSYYQAQQSQLQAAPPSQLQPPSPSQPQPQPQPWSSPSQPQVASHAHSNNTHQQSIYTERTREVEHRERTVSSTASRVSSSVMHDRKASGTSKLSSTYSSRTESEKERRAREVAAERDRVERERVVAERERLERDRVERERVVAERERLERERIERERVVERERSERERIERERVVERERLERERIEREKVAAERERLEKERIGRAGRERETKRMERERDAAERFERERTEKERVERERAERERAREAEEIARAEREQATREAEEIARAEREQAEREQAEREQTEKERMERERIAAEEAAAAWTAPASAKTKKGKKASKLNSPVDLADTTVGKSPGGLAQTLNSIWGSQSKTGTPAASPFPTSARSVDTTTPRSEFPPARELDPATPALGEANSASAFFAETTETHIESSSLAIDVTQGQELTKTEAEGAVIGHTPADSVPPEQLIIGEAHEQVSASTEVVETKVEETQASSVFEAEVSEQTGASVFDFNGTATGTTAAANEQTFNSYSWDSWGNSGATTTAAQETTETFSATNNNSAFSFGFGGTKPGSTWGMPSGPASLSKTFGAVGNIGSSLFGDANPGEIELDPLKALEGQQADAAGTLTLTTEGALGDAGESGAVTVPPPGGLEAVVGMPEPPAAAPEEPSSNADPSTTDAPTDGPADEDDGFAQTSGKKKKGGAGTGGGGKGKKKKK